MRQRRRGCRQAHWQGVLADFGRGFDRKLSLRLGACSFVTLSPTHAAIRVLRVLVSGLRMAWAEGIGFRAETDLRRERYAGDTTRRPRAAARRLFAGSTERRHPPLTAPAFPAGVAGLTLLHVGAIVSWFVHAGVRCVCATCAYAHIMRVRVLHPRVRKRLHGRDGWHQWDAKHWPPQHLCSRLT